LPLKKEIDSGSQRPSAMSNYDVIKYFVAQIDWISSTIDALLKGLPIPPATDQPGGKVGTMMDSLKELSSQYRRLEKQIDESQTKEQDFGKALANLQAQLNAEKEASGLNHSLQTSFKRSERRIEELINANQELKGHIKFLNEQLSANKDVLSAKTQIEQRLSLREMELKQVTQSKDEAETSAEKLKRQVTNLSEAMEGKTQVFEAIEKIADLTSISIQPEEILRRACALSAFLIHCPRATVFLRDPNSDAFTPLHSTGMSSAATALFKGHKLREAETPLLSELISRKHPIAIEDCRRFPKRGKAFAGKGNVVSFETGAPLLPKAYVDKLEIHSLLSVPLISKGDLSGVLFADYKGVHHPFSDNEMIAMDGLGQMIGMALDNIHTYKDTLKRLLELERTVGITNVLNEIRESIFSTNEVEQIISVVINTIPRLIGCDWVSALLTDHPAKGHYVLGNLGNLVRGKGTIPWDQTSFNGILRADQVLHRPNLQSESHLSPVDLHLLSHGIGSDLLLPIPVGGDIIGVLHLSSRRVAGFKHEDIVLGQKISEQLGEAIRRATAQRSEDRRRADGYYEKVRTLIESVSRGDFRLGDYRDQMIRCGVDIARSLELDEEQQEWIKYAVVLNDIGKSTVPDHILNKKAILTEREMAVLQTHPIQGAEMIKNFRFTELIRGMKFVKYVVPLVRHSYERWDGTGFPDGLAGDDIPLGARIMGVVNAYTAMIMERPYRPALRTDEAIREIQEGSGNQFDPRVVDFFIRYFRENNH